MAKITSRRRRTGEISKDVSNKDTALVGSPAEEDICQDVPKLGFLNLPGELRNRIYDLVFSHSELYAPVPRFSKREGYLSTVASLLCTCRQVNSEGRSLLAKTARGYFPVHQKFFRKWVSFSSKESDLVTSTTNNLVHEVKMRWDYNAQDFLHLRHFNILRPGPQDATAMSVLKHFRNVHIQLKCDGDKDFWPLFMLDDLKSAVDIIVMHSSCPKCDSEAERRVIVDLDDFFTYWFRRLIWSCKDDDIWEALSDRVCASLDSIFDIMMLATYAIWEVRYDDDLDDIYLQLLEDIHRHVSARCDESGGRIIEYVNLPAPVDSDSDSEELSVSDESDDFDDFDVGNDEDPYADCE